PGGHAGLRRAECESKPAGLPRLRVHRGIRGSARRERPRAGPSGGLGLGARCGGQAGCARARSLRHRRPPDEECALLRAGWGCDRTPTAYLEQLAGIDVEISDDPPPPPEGWEAFVSTAFVERVRGKTRAALLGELVSLRDSIVVAGAHGKTTTSAMIAFCLEELGRSPAWLIGADVPQLGGNAGTGEGWLVVEGDESDRTIDELRPRIAVVTNVDLDHHTMFGSRAEVAELFERWLEHAPAVVRGEELDPYDGPLAVAG